MNQTKKRILGMTFSLIALAITLVGLYLIRHFMPLLSDNPLQGNVGDLAMAAQLLWLAIGFFFLFRFLPGIIKWNAYFWGGLIFTVLAIVVMMETVPELKFINFTGLSLNPIEGCVIILIGVFFMLKGYLAYE